MRYMMWLWSLHNQKAKQEYNKINNNYIKPFSGKTVENYKLLTGSLLSSKDRIELFIRYPGCQRLFFSQDWERDLRWSRVSEARSAKMKKTTSGHSRTQNLISVQLIASDIPPNWFSPAARHLFVFIFDISTVNVFTWRSNPWNCPYEIEENYWYSLINRQFLLDLQLKFTEILWIRQAEFVWVEGESAKKLNVAVRLPAVLGFPVNKWDDASSQLCMMCRRKHAQQTLNIQRNLSYANLKEKVPRRFAEKSDSKNGFTEIAQ